MKNDLSDISVIALSVRLYQALLIVYPTRFRKEYGSLMLQVFGDCCLRAFRQNGINGMIELWAVTILDLVRSAIAEHLHKETVMTKPKFMRFSAWALMVGVTAYLPWFIYAMLAGTRFDPDVNGWYILNDLVVFGLVYGCILLPLGLLGLRERYGSQVGVLGRGILMAGALGGVGLGILFFYEMKYSLGEDIYRVYVIYLTGLILPFVSLLLFGMLTLRYKPLSRGNGLPLTAGLIAPVFIKLYGLLAGIRFLVEDTFFVFLSILGFIVMSVALIRFGYISQVDEAQITGTI